MKNKPITLGVVLPCFNEEEVIISSSEKLKLKIEQLIHDEKISEESFVCFVDDGSKDKTWDLIQVICTNKRFKAIKLASNFGHQNALLAGIFSMKDKADCLITIDADLQDDIHVFDDMIHNYMEGNLIVYGVRNNRESDTFFKKNSAEAFYKLMNFMKVKTVFNHADFRLVDSRVVYELEKFNEVSLFLRGIFPMMGFKSTNVYYKRVSREAGVTKYPLKKMIAFAWNGITSFSSMPLRIIFFIGITMFLLSLIFGAWVLITYLNGHTIKGWSSVLLLNLVFSGLNMICLGIIGEYIGKIYQEVKKRPRFIIDMKI
jgi:glycosyltransferase involved in cell wall biosynthesis